MGLDFDYTDGQTPLDEDEKDALLIPSITTRGELDEFEQLNIENAMVFYWSKRITIHKFFTEAFIKAVHKKMYGDVWMWAGEFRKTDKNIGVDKWTISIALKELLDDALYWVKHNVYKPEEIAIRFKHRLVSIHCFPNGNCRLPQKVVHSWLELTGKSLLILNFERHEKRKIYRIADSICHEKT
ncbi:MAG: mobile mystery protein B, partial [Sediminibacterium sp.]|uniref:mobile mystery protein B n=1 Tax=Sediminibacterium sp. TaxID=1917865 RepID=UPI002ABCAC3E